MRDNLLFWNNVFPLCIQCLCLPHTFCVNGSSRGYFFNEIKTYLIRSMRWTVSTEMNINFIRFVCHWAIVVNREIAYTFVKHISNAVSTAIIHFDGYSYSCRSVSILSKYLLSTQHSIPIIMRRETRKLWETKNEADTKYIRYLLTGARSTAFILIPLK